MQKNLFSFNKINDYKEGEILICCHDAGAATLIREWFIPYLSKVNFYIEGPAVNIFKKYKIRRIYNDLEISISKCNLLITGTGWSSNLEHKARKIAKKYSIKSIAVIDHWVNYDERFIRGKEKIMPDLIWVSDDYSYEKANQHFPKIEIMKLKNIWLEKIKKKVKNSKDLNINKKKYLPKKLLYFTEPIRLKWEGNEIGEIQALNYFFNKLMRLSQLSHISSIEKIEELRIRIHPSEQEKKYKKFLSNVNNKFPIYFDKYESLEESLINADACFGCETQALVVSLHCNIPTYCTIPSWGNKCRLPHKEIIHIKDL